MDDLIKRILDSEPDEAAKLLPQVDMNKAYLSTADSGRLIGISPKSVWQAIVEGKIESFRVGRAYNVKLLSALLYRRKRRERLSINPDELDRFTKGGAADDDQE